MTAEPPPPGAIVRYPYLWADQGRAGERGGRKDRPVCLVVSVYDPDAEIHHLALLAISSRPPGEHQRALPVPEIERHRIGLKRYSKAWIYVNEYNYDVAEKSTHLQLSKNILGHLSPQFYKLVRNEFLKVAKAGIVRVDRTR